MNVPPDLGKADAVFELAKQLGWDGVNPYSSESLKSFGIRLSKEATKDNPHKCRRFGDEFTITAPSIKPLIVPELMNGFPSSFGPYPPVKQVDAPSLTALSVQHGIVGLVNDAPVIFDQDGYIQPDYSSFYYPLVDYYGRGDCLDLSKRFKIDGVALVLFDDIGQRNYCHWLADWLPRMRALPDALENAFVIVIDCVAPWQFEMLQAFGFSADRVVNLQKWESAEARELIVPGRLTEAPHPAYKGADWAIDLLKDKLDVIKDPSPSSDKIYFSRADARVRKVENEDQFTQFLESIGFRRVTASGLTVAEQARAFRSATHVVALHGAGLTNIVFCNPGTKVLEIVPSNYGMPSFWLLANGAGLRYATYIANAVDDNMISQHENVFVDIEDFRAQAGRWLIGES